jgi:chromate reductase
MPYSFQVLGIAGSLRSGSYNRSLVRAAAELGPPGMQVVIFERLDEIPLYNEDLEAKGDPKPVAAFKTAIREADALLIATPEYNYGVPGPLKNAIDWASRPAASTPLKGKPALIIGASPGPGGTVRAQLALRQTFVYTQTLALPGPEFALQHCAEKFDSGGRLTDDLSRRLLAGRLHALMDFAGRLAGQGAGV